MNYLNFFVMGGDNINYFFKFLIPQLLEYFNNDKKIIKEFIPDVINKYQENILIENNKNKEKNEKK